MNKKGFYPYLNKETVEHYRLDSNSKYCLDSLSMEDGNYDFARQKEYAFSEDYVATDGNTYKFHSAPSQKYVWDEWEDMVAILEGRKPNVFVNTKNWEIITLEQCQKCNILPDWCHREDNYCQGTNCPYRHIDRKNIPKIV